MNIEKILKCLVPEYEIKRSSTKVSQNINVDIPKRECDNGETFESFFHGLMFMMNKDCDIELKAIKTHISMYEYVDTLNKKKISFSIENNSINNIVKLFLAMYYDINIFVYHENSKILKSYYGEEQLQISKMCVLFFYDNDKELFFTMDKQELIPYSFIQENFPSVLIASIGLTLDKVFSVGEKQSSFTFVTGEVLNDDNWINENNIITRKHDTQLYIPRTYDWRTFDIKAFNASFNAKKLLLELYSLKK